jgi:sirohydrochlorin ferrochelatase
LLVGHGSARRRSAPDAGERHAAALAAGGRFASVATAYLKGGPPLAESAHSLGSGDLVVVPFLMSDGHCARRLIPQALGLAGRVTRADGRRLIYCEPVGASPGLAEIIARRARGCCTDHGLEASRSEVLLVGHGSRQDPASRHMTLENGRRLAKLGAFGSVACAFLDEPPLAAEVIPGLAAEGPPVVVVGLFACDGRHAGEALPRPIAARRAGHRPVHYAGPIGADPEVAGLILERAEAALRAAT